MYYLKSHFTRAFATAMVFVFSIYSSAYAEPSKGVKIVGAMKINPTAVEICFSDSTRMTLDFYGENIFRLFFDPAGGILRDPLATPPAQILVDNPRKPVSRLEVSDIGGKVTVSTPLMQVVFNKENAGMQLFNHGKVVAQTISPIQIENGKTTLILKENPTEYFYGGGVQNGRFSHKGKEIAIGLPKGTASCGILLKKGNITLEPKRKGKCFYPTKPIT